MARDRGRSWARASSIRSRMPSRARSVGYGKGKPGREDRFDEKDLSECSSFLSTALLSETNNEPIHKQGNKKPQKFTKTAQSDLGYVTLDRAKGSNARKRSSSVGKDHPKSLTKTSSWFRRRSTQTREETKNVKDPVSPLILSRDSSSRRLSSVDGRYESLNDSRMNQSHASTHTTTLASSQQKSIHAAGVTSAEDLSMKVIRSALDVQEICRDDDSSGSEYEAPLIMTQLVIQESSVDGAPDWNVDMNTDSIEEVIEFSNTNETKDNAAGGSSADSANVALTPWQVSFNPQVESADIHEALNTHDVTFATADTSQSDLRLALPQLQEMEDSCRYGESLERAEPDLMPVGITTNGKQDESIELVQTAPGRKPTQPRAAEEKRESYKKRNKSWFSRFWPRQQNTSSKGIESSINKKNQTPKPSPSSNVHSCKSAKPWENLPPPPPPPPLKRRESRQKEVIKIYEPTVPVAKKNFQVFQPVASGGKTFQPRSDKLPAEKKYEPDDLNKLKIFTRSISKSSKQKHTSERCDYPFDHEDIKMIQVPTELQRTLSGLTAEEVVNFVMETAHLEDENAEYDNVECKLEGTKIMEIHSKKPIVCRMGDDDDLSGSIDFDALSEPSIDVVSAKTLENISWNINDYLKTGPLFAGQ